MGFDIDVNLKCFHGNYRRLYDWGYALYSQAYKRLYIFQFSTYIFSADITPEMLKLGRVTKVKVFFLVVVYVFDFQDKINLFEFSAAILEKGLLHNESRNSTILFCCSFGVNNKTSSN